jgi:accessory gene regulator B
MLEKLALKLTNLLCAENYNNPKDRLKIQYGLNVLLNEGFKLFFLVLFFHIIHHSTYFYLSLLILLTIRTFSGGIHIKGSINCLILTLLIFIFTCVLAPLIPELKLTHYISVTTLSILILWVKAPICSVYRPIRDNKKKLQYKIIAIFFTLTWSTILLSLATSSYINCGFVTILLQNIQLIFINHPTS